MMTDTGTNPRPLAVYRLMHSLLEDTWRLRFFHGALLDLFKWQKKGSPMDQHPTDFPAEWIGEPGGRVTGFPAGYQNAPIVSRRIADLLRNELLSAGKLLPMRILGGGPEDYDFYLVTEVIDCVDLARSSPPKERTGEIQRVVFRPDALPVGLPAFRVPQFPTAVYWNAWAVERLAAMLGEDLEARLCWSEDPDATPHHNPWGW